jgi:NADH-quinone oxidoreductase subunit G
MEAALDALQKRLDGFMELNGSAALGIVGSPRMSQEAAIMAARLRESTGAGALCYGDGARQVGLTSEAVALLNGGNSASQEDVRQADLIAIVACDLLGEAPMMALAVRQAWRNGATVFTISGECSSLTPHQLYESTAVASLADIPLANAARPVFICGANRSGLDSLQGDELQQVKRSFVLDGPNAFGTSRLAAEYGSVALEDALAGGVIKGLIVLEADTALDLPEDIRILAAADWMPTHLVERAEIVLPVTSWFEMDGTFVNNEGRAQRFKQVMKPGLPIKGLTPELHPPRLHRHDAPGGDMLPTWQIIVRLLKQVGDSLYENSALNQQWKLLESLDPEKGGIMMHERNQKQ